MFCVRFPLCFCSGGLQDSSLLDEPRGTKPSRRVRPRRNETPHGVSEQRLSDLRRQFDLLPSRSDGVRVSQIPLNAFQHSSSPNDAGSRNVRSPRPSASPDAPFFFVSLPSPPPNTPDPQPGMDSRFSRARAPWGRGRSGLTGVVKRVHGRKGGMEGNASTRPLFHTFKTCLMDARPTRAYRLTSPANKHGGQR